MITNKTEAVVNLLNQVIEEAVKDGGDSGGAYHQNQENLYIAISNLLDCLTLSRDYEVVDTQNFYDWSNIKIKARINSFKIEEIKK